MKSTFIISAILIVTLIGCDSKPKIELTKEQAVYETLFLKIIGEAHSKYYLVETTEANWFKENPYEESDWLGKLEALGGINIELIKELYKKNKKSDPINWNPFITNAHLLPPEYNVNPRKSNKNCLVPSEEGNVNIYKNNKGYRSYFTVSNVVFSEDGKKAILKYSRHCAPMSGAGEFFAVFEFVDNQWKVVGGRMLWIS